MESKIREFEETVFEDRYYLNIESDKLFGYLDALVDHKIINSNEAIKYHTQLTQATLEQLKKTPETYYHVFIDDVKDYVNNMWEYRNNLKNIEHHQYDLIVCNRIIALFVLGLLSPEDYSKAIDKHSLK